MNLLGSDFEINKFESALLCSFDTIFIYNVYNRSVFSEILKESLIKCFSKKT